jgi:magnesium transporter
LKSGTLRVRGRALGISGLSPPGHAVIEADEFARRLSETLKGGDALAVQSALDDVPAADIAEAAAHLEEDDVVALLKALPEEISADVLTLLDDDVREHVLERLTPLEIAEAVEEMASDDAADVLAELEEDKADEVVDLLNEEDRREVTQLLAYPEDTAGGIMQLEVVWVREDRTAARAIEKIREAYGDVEEDFHEVFVVTKDKKLAGKIPVTRLILAAPATPVTALMDTDVHAVQAELDQEEVAQVFEKYDVPTVPVVDRDGVLLGRITVDDIVDVIHEEAEEDYSRLAGTTEAEFGEESVMRKAAIRFPWLVTGLGGGILSALVLSRFEENLQALITLAFFVPVITAMGGNVAIQSSAVMVRGLATGEVKAQDAISRLLREVGVSILTGFALASLVFAVAYLGWGDLRLGIVVGGAMLAVVLVATSVGALVPLTLDRLKIDPALATGPFVTTSNDIVGILIYLTLASVVYRRG